MPNEVRQKSDAECRADHWLSHAQAILEREQEVMYSPLFFEIFERESDGRYIAESLAHLLIQNYARHDKYRLEVGRWIQDERTPGISFKEMRIYSLSQPES